MEINGTTESPKIIGNLGINNPGFDRINGDTLYNTYSYSDYQLNINQGYLLLNGGEYYGNGYIPVNLDLISQDKLQITKLDVSTSIIIIAINY